MQQSLRTYILSFILICCLQATDIFGQSEKQDWSAEEKEIIAAVDNLLFEVGNYNIGYMEDMISENAVIGNSFLRMENGPIKS